ncbi:GNAT family N-acetyltransferase [Vaginisenegalia massiliensis]|uniref:GNAT family N-acetyltransferase n=1 Tax=Vaginisenegalia massiliensis TaxID=2058294 RepID=UPI000F52576E|nr:GNAT family N-acetyltransferase [Vaginisenegalia massiliensis]
MLVRSKNKNEKIVLGLLSYTSTEAASSEELRELLKRYCEKDSYEIFLYKDNQHDNFLGLLAIECLQGANDLVGQSDQKEQEIIYIHRVAVIPSFRNEGVGYQMFKELRSAFPLAQILGSMEIADIVSKWQSRFQSEIQQKDHQ